jgi:hypothetical protein
VKNIYCSDCLTGDYIRCMKETPTENDIPPKLKGSTNTAMNVSSGAGAG